MEVEGGNYSFFDDLLKSFEETGAGEQDVDSDVIQINDDNVDGEVLIGPMLNLFRSEILGDEDYWITTELATAVALQDFNKRSAAYGTEFPSDCNLYLTMSMGTQGKELTHVAEDYQDRILSVGNGTRPFAVLGGVTSRQSFLIATLGAVSVQSGNMTLYEVPEIGLKVSRQGVPNISPFSTAIELDEASYVPMFSRTVPANTADARALCLYFSKKNVKFVGIFYGNSVYGVNYFAALSRMADDFGIQLVGFPYSPQVGFNFTAILNQLQTSQMRYMVGALEVKTWRVAIQALLDAKLLNNPDYVWFFSESLDPAIGHVLTDSDSASAQSLAEALNRTLIVRPAAGDNYERHKQELTAYKEDPGFVEYYHSQYGVNLSETVLQPSVFSMLAYDSVLSLGLAGCVASANKTFFWGPELHQYIAGLDFQGATGNVTFNVTSTRNPSGLSYEIANIFVDSYNGSAFETRAKACIQTTADGLNETCNFTFVDGTTKPPAVLPPVDENLNQVPLGVNIFVWILAALVFLFTVYCVYWTIRHRERPIVRASQPLFLVVICMGTLLVAIEMIFSTFQDGVANSGTCMASAWLLSIGFTTIFSALFSKTWRISRIYANAKRFRRVKVDAKDVMWPIAVLLSVNIIILIVWTIVDPLEWERYVIEEDFFGRVTSSRGACLYIGDGQTTEWIFLGLVVAVNLITLILSNYISYKSRKLPSDFNESKYIAISNVILLEAIIIGVPVLLVVRDSSTSVVLVHGLSNAILCFGVLIPVFVPKFTKEKDEKNHRYVASSMVSSVEIAAGQRGSMPPSSGMRTSGYISKAGGGSRISGISGLSGVSGVSLASSNEGQHPPAPSALTTSNGSTASEGPHAADDEVDHAALEGKSGEERAPEERAPEVAAPVAPTEESGEETTQQDSSPPVLVEESEEKPNAVGTAEPSSVELLESHLKSYMQKSSGEPGEYAELTV